MVVLINAVFGNSFLFWEGGVGETVSKLNHNIKQSYNISEQYLIWECVEDRALREKNVLKVRIQPIVFYKQA